MYKILIVDDEAIVREGIKNRIDWKEHGFECVGDSDNGRDALEAVKHLRPDVVLTDISMPFMDGLELSRHIVEQFPSTKIIILTGFDDFEYAQKAVKLQVTDFILKPITSAEIRQMLNKLKLEMDEERGHQEHLNRMKQLLNESLPVLKERFLERLATSPLKEWEIAEKVRYFSLPLNGPAFISLAVEIDELRPDQQGTDQELHAFGVYNIVQEVLSEEPQSAVFRYKGNKAMALLSGDSPGKLYAKARELAEQIRTSVKSWLLFTVSVGVGTVCGDLQDVHHSCRAAAAALEYRLLLGSDQVICISNLEKRGSQPVFDSSENEKGLVSAIKTGTAAEVEQWIAKLIRELKHSSISMEQCYYRVLKIMLAVLQALIEIGCREQELFRSEKRLLTELYSFRTLAEIEDWLKDICGRALKDVAAARRDLTQSQMREAVDYIMEHYEDPGLSVKTVCSRVYMSSSYFSTMFKDYTGKTFVEYLTSVRMDKAKELLKHTLLKNYEVAARTGYQDPQYFSVLFKKYAGCTPTEYRQMLQADGA